MPQLVIKGALVVNEGKVSALDVLIRNGRIEKVAKNIATKEAKEIDADGLHLLPGVIDDQVHFREPGLTHKATIKTESKAAVAGGVTSFMEMPNTKPPTVTQKLLEEKYAMASRSSAANYSFYMGASNDNLKEVLKTNPKKVCGVKVFMGSSTGNMLVDDDQALTEIFKKCHMLIAVHCEDEGTIKANEEAARLRFGENVPMAMHPEIRSVKACLLSSAKAVALAEKHKTRLHILHISTANELELFTNRIPLEQKRITAEACVHHLWFDSKDYGQLGTRIKCNPAIKTSEHRQALLQAVNDDRIDVLATDHAPHTRAEKQSNYFEAPSGVPLIQHSLLMMLDFHHKGLIKLEKVVEKMCHAPAICFKVKERGFIREGYWADMVLVDLSKGTTVTKDSILYKCAWSPFEGQKFSASVRMTLVNGEVGFDSGKGVHKSRGMRLEFRG
jgi:dihydroorotase